MSLKLLIVCGISLYAGCNYIIMVFLDPVILTFKLGNSFKQDIFMWGPLCSVLSVLIDSHV
jgi:hypothetical protein